MKGILLMLTMILLITSCKHREATYVDADTKFIVKNVQELNGCSFIVKYDIEAVCPNDIARIGDGYKLEFSFCDTIDKFKIGDVIHFAGTSQVSNVHLSNISAPNNIIFPTYAKTLSISNQSLTITHNK